MTRVLECPHGCKKALDCLGLDQGGSLPAGCPFDLPERATDSRASKAITEADAAIREYVEREVPELRATGTSPARKQAIISACVDRIVLAAEQGEGWLATVAFAELTTAWACGEAEAGSARE